MDFFWSACMYSMATFIGGHVVLDGLNPWAHAFIKSDCFFVFDGIYEYVLYLIKLPAFMVTFVPEVSEAS